MSNAVMRQELKIKQQEKEIEDAMKAELEAANQDPPPVPELEPEVEDTTPEPEPTKEIDEEEETFKKRYGDLRKHSQKLEERIKELEKAEPDPEAAPAEAPQSERELEAWMEENPQSAGLLTALVARLADERYGSDIEVLKKDKVETEKEKAEIAILKSHEDWNELKESDKFLDWLDEQPSWAQDSIYESRLPRDAIRVLDLYKADMGLTEKAKADTARDAVASAKTKSNSATPPSGEEKTKYTESMVNKMSSTEYEKHSKAIDKAMANGTFVYDLSRR